MIRTCASVLAAMALVLFWTATVAGFEPGEVDGEVVPGSVDNVATFKVSNPSRTLDAEQLDAEVLSTPVWVSITAVEADSEGVLPAGATRRFSVVFDVTDTAAIGSVDRLEIGFVADTALFDQDSLSITLGVVEPPEEEEETAGPGAPPALRLERIERTGEGDTAGGTLHQQGSFQDSQFEEILSAGFGAIPGTIKLGSPISFKASAVRSVQYAEDSFCFPWDPEPDSHSVHLSVTVAGASAETRGELGMFNYCRGNLKREVVWSGGGRYYSWTNVFTDSTTASVSLTPDGSEPIERSGRVVGTRFFYGVAVGGQPELLDSRDSDVRIEQRYQTDSNGYAISEVPSGSGLTVSLRAPTMTNGHSVSVILYYVPMQSLDQPATAMPHEHPPPFPPTPGSEDTDTSTIDGGEGTPGDPTPDVPVHDPGRQVPPVPIHDPGEEVPPAPFDDPSDRDPGTPPPTGDDTTPGFDPGNPDTLNPDQHPEVAAFIRQWLSVADPPENALPGVHFEYDQFGRMIGGGGSRGRVVGSHDSVDYGSGVSSEAKVWSTLRGQLDSINHCTLEEYVLASLQSQSIDHCRGRYGALRDLRGVKLSTARAEIVRAGFEINLSGGSPAPTQEAGGTIEHQEPNHNRVLFKGQTINLVVHGPWVPATTTVPDLVGSSTRMASAWLKDLGLVAMVRPGNAAPTARLVGAVESQAPEPGWQIPVGSPVTLNVYGNVTPLAPPPPTPVPPPPGIDCSRWPGSVAVYDAATGGTRCDCPQGSQWNSSGTGCQASVSTDQQHCDNNWPGTSARRDPATGTLECQCPAGLGWDDVARGCVRASTVEVQPITPDQGGSCAHMPGTVAQRDPATGRTQCLCPVGRWDSSQRRCVVEELPPLDPPECPTYYTSIRVAASFGRTADAQREEQAARAAGCDSGFIADALGTSPLVGTTTGGGPGTGGADCESLGRSLSEPVFQSQITPQQAESQMRSAGCGDQLDSLCPWGAFGMGSGTYPDCLGQVAVGPGPARGDGGRSAAGPGGGHGTPGSGGGQAPSGPTCWIQAPIGQGDVTLLFSARFGQHTNYYINTVPSDSMNNVVTFYRRQHGASQVGSPFRNSNDALREARRRCPNPVSVPGGGR